MPERKVEVAKSLLDYSTAKLLSVTLFPGGGREINEMFNLSLIGFPELKIQIKPLLMSVKEGIVALAEFRFLAV